MARTATYQNNFDTPSGPGVTTLTPITGSGGSGSASSIRSYPGTDADNELVVYNGSNRGGYLEFGSESFEPNDNGYSEKASSFTFTSNADVVGVAGGIGNGAIDGFSFNLGAVDTLRGVSGSGLGSLENGVSIGLSIRILPLGNRMEVVWNGTVLGTNTSNRRRPSTSASRKVGASAPASLVGRSQGRFRPSMTSLVSRLRIRKVGRSPSRGVWAITRAGFGSTTST